MAPKKMVMKSCPGCSKQLHVATKACVCGHSFRKLLQPSSPSDDEDKPLSPTSADAAAGGDEEATAPAGRRRTREKPKFYDASQYQREPKRRKSKPEVYLQKMRLEEKRLAKLRMKREERERSKGQQPGAGDAEAAGAAEVEAQPVYEDILVDATRDEMRKYGVVLSAVNAKLAIVNPAFG